MHAKTTMVLVALLALIGAYFYFIDANAPAPHVGPPSAELSSEPLLDAHALAQVDTITLNWDKESATFERVGAGWSQTQPVVFPVETSAMEELIAAAASLVSIQTLEANPLGKANLQATLTFDSAQRHPITLELGTKTLAGRGLLSLADQSLVHVVDDRLHQAVLDRPYRNWRKTHLQAPAAAGCSQIHVATSDQTLTLTKQAGRWFLDAAYHERADTQAVETWVQGISDMTIKSFIADAPGSLMRFGLDDASVTVTLVLSGADSQPQVLRIGSPADMESKTYYAIWGATDQTLPVVFTISDTDRAQFLVDADAMRDPRVMTLEATDVDRVSLHRPGQGDWVMSRTANGFTLAGSDQPVDLVKAQDLLQALTHLRSQGFVHHPDAAAVHATITLEADGLTQPMTFEVYPDAAEDDWLIKRHDQAYGYRIPRAAMTRILEPSVGRSEH